MTLRRHHWEQFFYRLPREWSRDCALRRTWERPPYPSWALFCLCAEEIYIPSSCSRSFSGRKPWQRWRRLVKLVTTRWTKWRWRKCSLRTITQTWPLSTRSAKTGKIWIRFGARAVTEDHSHTVFPVFAVIYHLYIFWSPHMPQFLDVQSFVLIRELKLELTFIFRMKDRRLPWNKEDKERLFKWCDSIPFTRAP